MDGKESKNEKNEGEAKANVSNEEIEKEYADLKERHLRLIAEFDNYKKSVIRDMSNAKEQGAMELMRQLLGILDEFDLMLIAAAKSADKELAKGLELLYANFVDALRRFGLEEVETQGKADPYKHEVALCIESKEDEGKIIEVIKKGYTMNGKLIRPATVIVSKGNEGKEGSNESNGNENGKNK